jgi:hypothetical protein
MTVAARTVAIVAPMMILMGCPSCSGSHSGADSIGRGDSCQIHDSALTNGAREVAQVREAVCETSAGFLGPDVASIFVFVHEQSVPKDPSNVVMRYEVVCPDTGDCNFPRLKVKWLSRSSLLITLLTFGDVYCLKRATIDNISIGYSKTPLRDPPQDAFTSTEFLCQ